MSQQVSTHRAPELILNPLANPKGVKKLCELCQKPAFLECLDCRVTYYCTKEHQIYDYRGIHEKICQLLVPLRTVPSFFTSGEERNHHIEQTKIRQKFMIDLTRTTGQKLLFQGKHEQAVPAAMQALKFAIDVYGLSSIELVPSYLILGEASIGMGQLPHAEEYLSQAQWTVLKTPEVSHSILSRLHRNVGLLYAAKGQYSQALSQLGNDIFHSSEANGTDNVRTSGGYFHMANVFTELNKYKTADSLYRKVVTIWYVFLEKYIEQKNYSPVNQQLGGIIEQKTESILDEAQEAEALQVLNTIYEFRLQTEDLVSIAKTSYTLAMLYYVLHHYAKSETVTTKALSAITDEEESGLKYKNKLTFLKKLIIQSIDEANKQKS